MSLLGKRIVMARPIAATPILTGDEALSFMIRIDKESHKLVSLTPTPKLHEAHKLVKKYAERRQKHIR